MATVPDTVGSNALGWPDMPLSVSQAPREPEYVLWPYTGRESVIFYPPGSVEEHLVIEHGIDSHDVRRQSRGHRYHATDHAKQADVHLGVVGDLSPVGHTHEEAAA